jgi:drug/metabolite transporter (DMT)-like permease
MNSLIKIGLGLCIAIVFPFMVGFGIESFYIAPKQAYDVCRTMDPNIPAKEGQTAPAYADPQNNSKYKDCFDKAQEKTDIYSKNLFLIATAFGFLAIIVGTLLFSEKIGPVGPGLVFGGLFTILYGTTRSFRSLDKMWIFIELLIVFIGIILVTWRYIKTVNRKK